MDYSKLVVIDSVCPARNENTLLLMDLDVSQFIVDDYP